MIITEKVEQNGHWYTTQGTPAYTTIGKTGERPTTLRDAKKLEIKDFVENFDFYTIFKHFGFSMNSDSQDLYFWGKK